MPKKHDGKSGKVRELAPRRKRVAKFPVSPGAFGYLLDIMQDMGYSKSDGKAFNWVDIRAWYDISGLSLEYWELKMLIEMSWVYVSWYNKAQDSKCPMPDWYVRNL